MIRAIFWKEWREQRTTVAVLMIAGCALIITVGQSGLFGMTASTKVLYGTPVGHAVVMLLVAASSLVCGAALLACEREQRTQPFLDQLPVSRGQLWRAKSAYGLALAVAQTGILVALAWWADLFGRDAPGWLAFYLALGLTMYCWGLLGSALSGSALSAVGVAVLCMPVGVIVAAVAYAVLDGLFDFRTDGGAVLAVALISGVLAAAASAVTYSRPAQRREAPRVRRPRFRLGVSNSAWLVWRQARWLALIFPLLGLFTGLLFLIPGFWGLAIWPAVTLLIGWFCGLAAFHDEQMGGLSRLWGEQRLPAVRLWVLKVAVFFGIAVLSSLLMLLPGYLAVETSAEALSGSERVDPLSAVMFSELPFLYADQTGIFLFLWVAYGFAAGLAVRLFCRKPFVAGPIALFAAAGTAVLWVPSLLTGGLHAWQVWTPALVVLAGSALFARLWARGRLGSATGVLAAGSCLLLALGAQALGIAYRVWEVPGGPDPLAESGFVESLPDPAGDEARRLFIEAAADFNAALRDITPDEQSDWKRGEWLREIAEIVRKTGWDAAATPKSEELDRLFGYTWDERLSALPDLPAGVIEPPGGSVIWGTMEYHEELDRMTIALVARGLQRQAGGDHRAFLDNLAVGLALVRNYRNKAEPWVALRATSAERVWADAHAAWLDAVGDRPELPRESAALWERHADEMPTPGEELTPAAQLTVRRSLSDPQDWLPFPSSPYRAELRQLRRERDAELVLTALQVPWEAERLRRVHRAAWLAPEGALWLDENRNRPVVAAVRIFRESVKRAEAAERRTSADRRAALLMAALVRYRIENGSPAEHLGRLVPDYLEAVPADPYDGGPFRYRVSDGETIHQEGEEEVRVPAGRGILWSVGEDGEDDGGVVDLGSRAGSPLLPEQGSDRIYLVPMP